MIEVVLWIVTGMLLMTTIRMVVSSVQHREWPEEKAAKLPNAKQLRRNRIELTKRLTNRTVRR